MKFKIQNLKLKSIKNINRQKLTILILLTAITLIGGVIRFYQLGSYPAGFFCDEAGQTFNAYTLLTTGKDFRGNPFPFYVDIFGPIGPVAVYDQIPAVAIFGLNEFASRATAAFIGTITIIVVFFSAYVIFKQERVYSNKPLLIGLFAATLTAISPWHIQFSRFGTENIRVPFYFSLSLLCLFLGISKNKKILIIVALLFTYLCFYSYTATNLFLPPFMIGTLLIYRKFFFRDKVFLLLLVLLTVILSIPFVNHLITFKNDNRFAVVSVFHNHSLQEGIQAMTKTYIESYSLNFLFLKGDVGMPGHFINRFSVKGFGELYLFTLPFFILGLLLIIKKFQQPQNQLLLLWLLLYPIGSAVAGADGGGPFATRSIIGVLVFQIITAVGIVYFIFWCKQKRIKFLSIILLLLAIVFSTTQYLYQYFVVYPNYSLDFWGWQFGARDIVHYFAQNQSHYNEEIMAPEFNAPNIFFKFYAPVDCMKCKIGLPEDSYNSKLKQIFAVTPTYLSQHPEFTFQAKKKVVYPNGSIAFLIGTIENPSDKNSLQ